jgi:hypothetical protein
MGQPGTAMPREKKAMRNQSRPPRCHSESRCKRGEEPYVTAKAQRKRAGPSRCLLQSSNAQKNRPSIVRASYKVGSVHTLYKKRLRDGDQFTGFREKVKEELGDILWYLTAIASLEDLSLEDIAVHNLEKISSRWSPTGEDDWVDFDEHFPPEERLPRLFTAQFVASVEDGIPKVEVFIDGERLGAKLNDNSYVSDGYRFHDIFHMTCAALLGWSPVVRALMKRKRKSDKEIDDVEDGGRAIVTDEALAASYSVMQFVTSTWTKSKS